jgi:hypothetical protein
MKCVRLLQTARKGDVVRVTNVAAQEMVRTKYAEYVPKLVWKQTGRQYMTSKRMNKHIRRSKSCGLTL